MADSKSEIRKKRGSPKESTAQVVQPDLTPSQRRSTKPQQIKPCFLAYPPPPSKRTHFFRPTQLQEHCPKLKGSEAYGHSIPLTGEESKNQKTIHTLQKDNELLVQENNILRERLANLEAYLEQTEFRAKFSASLGTDGCILGDQTTSSISEVNTINGNFSQPSEILLTENNLLDSSGLGSDLSASSISDVNIINGNFSQTSGTLLTENYLLDSSGLGSDLSF